MSHTEKRLFEQIIECSDVGIDPEIETELEEIKAFGLQRGEQEDTSEYILKVKIKILLHLLKVIYKFMFIHILPKFDYDLIAKHLFKAATSEKCLARNKKIIFDLVKK